MAQRETFDESLSRGKTLNLSTQSRIEAASDAIVLWFFNPVFGVGPGNYADARSERFELRGLKAGMSAHNTMLQILAETGTLGMIIFLGLILKGFKALKIKGVEAMPQKTPNLTLSCKNLRRLL